MSRRILLAILLVAALWGCGEKFDPASLLQNTRVIAIVAEPPKLTLGESVSLRAYSYIPPDLTVASETWSFCPVHLSSFTNPAFSCFSDIPECNPVLEPNEDGVVVANPLTLALACFEALGAQGVELPEEQPNDEGEGEDEEKEESIEVLFRYRIEDSSGFSRDAVMRVEQHFEPEITHPNSNPVIKEVRFDDVIVSEGDVLELRKEKDTVAVEIELDEASRDLYMTASGEEYKEDFDVNWFSTAGRFEDDEAIGVDISVTFKADPLELDETEAQIWAVVRDGQGGQTVFGPVTIPLEPAAE